MAEITTGTATHQVYSTHHRDEIAWSLPTRSADEIEIVHTQPPVDPDFPPVNRGRFQRGHDPRRHRFSSDECSRGFYAAVESIIIRYPDAIMPDGRHMVCNFLKNRTPHTYEQARRRRQEEHGSRKARV